MKTQSKADLMILGVTLFWGSSYLFMKIGLNSLQSFNLIGLRFSIAFLLAAVVFCRRLMKADLKLVRNALVLGIILFSAFTFIVFGVKFTTISNAGFLTSLTVIFVPIISVIFLKQKPQKRVFWGVGLSITGIALLTLNSQLTLNKGDIFCILGALLYAIHIIVTGQLTKNVDSIALGVLQLGFTGGLGLIFSSAIETPTLPHTYEAWVSVLALSILCSAVGFIAQTAAQKYTTPTHTGLIFSLEPVVAAALAILVAGETLPARGYMGGILVLLGVLNAEVDIKKKKAAHLQNPPGLA